MPDHRGSRAPCWNLEDRSLSRRPFPPGLAALAAVAAAGGAAVGAWVKLNYPDPGTGEQPIFLGAAALLLLVVALLVLAGPLGRAFLVGSLALFGGIAAALVILPTEPRFRSGLMTIRLERPVESVASGPAVCDVTRDHVQVSGQFGRAPDGGPPPVTVYIGRQVSEDRAAEPAGSQWMTITVEDDGTDLLGIEWPRGELQLTPDTLLEGQVGDWSGNLRFTRSTAPPDRGGATLGALRGTVEWTCGT